MRVEGQRFRYAVRKLLDSRPESVLAVEISEQFRAGLERTFAAEIDAGTLTVTGDDAKSLPLADGSVDVVRIRAASMLVEGRKPRKLALSPVSYSRRGIV